MNLILALLLLHQNIDLTACLAQLVEHFPRKEKVTSSTLVAG